MVKSCKYLYKIELVTNNDVNEFLKIATKFPGKIFLVNGKKKLSAKSFLGVHLAKITWDEIYVESDENCYFEFRKFIAE